MAKLPRNLSGKTILKILTNKFGFIMVSAKGSHMTLMNPETGKRVTIVLDPKIGAPLLGMILKDADISREDFLKAK